MANTTTRPPSASRLPRTRESRPLVLGLAILLIVGGAVGSAYLAIQSGHRAYYVAVDREVPQGSKISSDDLGRVSLPEDFQHGIRTGDVKEVVGKSATTRLLPGTVVIPEMLSSKLGPTGTQVVASFAVDRNLLPRSAQPGAKLALQLDAEADDPGDAVLADLLELTSKDSGGSFAGSSDDTVKVTVAVDQSCQSALAQGAAKKTIIPTVVGPSSDVSEKCG